ncbi:tyrosine-type recombinase/integrase [Brucella pituitosa]|uniref:Tyrosine-type recombinase/integrase n=1 Tax=Brucella pituitosa TaxID=571256 RepID=A0A643F3H4_9HYPH|nr:tyrosine-type recombinase/integrase [Brucella pituitosa]KAB0572627.1 tyrosine-type recombinase/integrase [Brucella pituitosa]
MAIVRVKGFQIWQDKKLPYKWRCRHRKTGTMIDTVKFPLGSLSFLAECSRIQALLDKGENSKPGTLGMLISRYRAGVSFQDLALRTKADYQRIFDYLQPIADTPIDRFTPPLVVKIRDKAAEKHGRRFGNYVKTVMALTFAWGLERGYVKINPALNIKGIRRPKGTADANRPWTDAERHAVLEALPSHMALPMILMMYCGLDPQDALQLSRSSISDGKIDTQRGKTGVAVWLPLPSPVVEALERAPKHTAITVCANSYGRPWTYNGFSTNWAKLKKKLEETGTINPGLTLKGLRHTVATILREMGKDHETIAAMLGHKTEAMAKHYSRRADVSKLMSATVTDLDAEMNRRRTKTVKPA